MLYNLLKNLINNKRFIKEDMLNKLNVFYIFNQISEKEYTELLSIVTIA